MKFGARHFVQERTKCAFLYKVPGTDQFTLDIFLHGVYDSYSWIQFKKTVSDNNVYKRGRFIVIMTVSERVFERIRQLNMTQKEFAEKTGILQSTISEWKKNKTNPSSDKIMTICRALDVTPEWLLSGIDPAAGRNRGADYYIINTDTDTGMLVECFNKLEKEQRDRVLGYAEAFAAMREGKDKK